MKKGAHYIRRNTVLLLLLLLLLLLIIIIIINMYCVHEKSISISYRTDHITIDPYKTVLNFLRYSPMYN